jgi:hypothetical protein
MERDSGCLSVQAFGVEPCEKSSREKSLGSVKAHFPAKISHTLMKSKDTLKFLDFCLDNGEPLNTDIIHPLPGRN